MKLRIKSVVVSVVALIIGTSGCWAKRTPPHVIVAVYQHSLDEPRPQYRLYLRGAGPNEVHFSKLSLRTHKAEGPATRYDVLGTGSITWGSNTIEINAGVVQVNGKQLPSTEYRSFVIDPDGKVVNGFIRTFD